MIKHFFGNEETREQLLMLNKWNTDNHDVFFYGSSFVQKNFRSIWGTVFFNWSFFISFVATEKDFEENFQAFKQDEAPVLRA